MAFNVLRWWTPNSGDYQVRVTSRGGAYNVWVMVPELLDDYLAGWASNRLSCDKPWGHNGALVDWGNEKREQGEEMLAALYLPAGKKLLFTIQISRPHCILMDSNPAFTNRYRLLEQWNKDKIARRAVFGMFSRKLTLLPDSSDPVDGLCRFDHNDQYAPAPNYAGGSARSNGGSSTGGSGSVGPTHPVTGQAGWGRDGVGLRQIGNGHDFGQH